MKPTKTTLTYDLEGVRVLVDFDAKGLPHRVAIAREFEMYPTWVYFEKLRAILSNVLEHT